MNAIGRQLHDPINSGLSRWRLTSYVDAVVESGRNPVSKHQIQPECGVENEQAHAGRDGRTCLTRLNSLARTGTGRKDIFPIHLTSAGLGSIPG